MKRWFEFVMRSIYLDKICFQIKLGLILMDILGLFIYLKTQMSKLEKLRYLLLKMGRVPKSTPQK